VAELVSASDADIFWLDNAMARNAMARNAMARNAMARNAMARNAMARNAMARLNGRLRSPDAGDATR
jgi:pentapeptide MXKDX repeat protein